MGEITTSGVVRQFGERGDPILMQFSPNALGRDFVCGDIHGLKDRLLMQLNEIGFDKEKDRLFCLGDLIDRGSDSLGCLELIYEKWFFTVRGNHDQFFIEYFLCGRDDEDFELFWIRNGGAWFKSEDKGYLKVLAKDLSRLAPLKILIGDRVGLVHADVKKNRFKTKGVPCKEEFWLMMQDRRRFKGGKTGFIEDLDRMYVGHTKCSEKVVIGNVHYMDSGAVYGENPIRIEEIPAELLS